MCYVFSGEQTVSLSQTIVAMVIHPEFCSERNYNFFFLFAFHVFYQLTKFYFTVLKDFKFIN